MTQRNTIQRELVLNAVKHLKNHPTPDDVYQYINKSHPNVSRSTVYRNLSILCENGQLQKVRTINAADHVDHTLHPHYHICCEKCGKVFDAELPYIPDLVGRINNLNGFEIKRYDIVFSGFCPNCKRKTYSREGN